MSRLLRKEMLKTSDLSKDIKTEEGLQKEFKLFRIHLFCCKTLSCMINVATILSIKCRYLLHGSCDCKVWFSQWSANSHFHQRSQVSRVIFWLTGKPIKAYSCIKYSPNISYSPRSFATLYLFSF